MSTIVGLDLSLTSTGACRIEDGRISLGRIQSKGAADASLADRRARLSDIAWRIFALTSQADLVVVEAPAFSRTTGHHHDRSGLWWLIVDALITSQDSTGEEPCRVVEVSPTTLKRYATGKGNASKDAVLAAVVRRYPDVEVTGNDQADALVLAAMGARWLGEPIEDSLPQVNLAAMEAVRWGAS